MLAYDQIVGSSNSTMDEVNESQAIGVDYVAIGPIYPTETTGKSGSPVLGTEMVSSAKAAVSQPVVAIGGIGAQNVAEVVSAGADAVGVVSAVTLADDPEAAAGALVEAIQNAKR